MKVAKFFAVIFAVVGIVLMLGTGIVCFASIDSAVKILENPDKAVTCSEDFMTAFNDGDFKSAGKLIYGQPDFGTEGALPDTGSAMIWDAYIRSMSFSYTSRLYLLDSELARDASVKILDVKALTGSIQTRAKALLEKEVAAATDMNALYDQTGDFRKDLMDRVLLEAVQSALREDVSYITRDVTVKLICRDGQWWVVPDQELLNTVSGFGM